MSFASRGKWNSACSLVAGSYVFGMEWTQEQKNRIFDDRWRGYLTHCPHDHARLEVEIKPIVGPRGLYVLTARCPRCQNHLEMGPQDDPKRKDFRAWTNEEKSQIIDQHFANGSVSCPVCQALFRCEGSADVAPVAIINCRCPRCGNSYSHGL
jgi:hypothetical protein